MSQLSLPSLLIPVLIPRMRSPDDPPEPPDDPRCLSSSSGLPSIDPWTAPPRRAYASPAVNRSLAGAAGVYGSIARTGVTATVITDWDDDSVALRFRSSTSTRSFASAASASASLRLSVSIWYCVMCFSASSSADRAAADESAASRSVSIAASLSTCMVTTPLYLEFSCCAMARGSCVGSVVVARWLCLEATIAAFRARVASSSAFIQLFPFGMDVIRSPVRARAGGDVARRLFEFEVEVKFKNRIDSSEK